MIIPFFIPHAGCPHQCVFCNQTNITGQDGVAAPAAVPRRILDYLDVRNSPEPVHLAFYGGSFTALPLAEQAAYLEAARPFIENGRIADIRLSTRPDCITPAVLDLLAGYHVRTVELGAQSMDDRVLALSGRGHTAQHTADAAAMLREYRFTVGLQLMPGLPGDSAGIFRRTVEAAIGLKPDFVRLYPALVIRGTPLERLFRAGRYAPLPLGEAVSICREAFTKFERSGISVVRMGLQPTEELERPGTILAGPWHPAFGQLVESSVFLDAMRAALREAGGTRTTAVFEVHPRDVSAAAGQRRENIERLKKEFGLASVRIVAGRRDEQRGGVILHSD